MENLNARLREIALKWAKKVHLPAKITISELKEEIVAEADKVFITGGLLVTCVDGAGFSKARQDFVQRFVELRGMLEAEFGQDGLMSDSAELDQHSDQTTIIKSVHVKQEITD